MGKGKRSHAGTRARSKKHKVHAKPKRQEPAKQAIPRPEHKNNTEQLKRQLLLAYIGLITLAAIIIALLFSQSITITGRAVGEPLTAWRVFTTPVGEGETFTVTIEMEVDGATYYAFEETVPEGFTITDYQNEPGGAYQASYDPVTRTLRGVYVDIDNPGQEIPTEYRSREYTCQASSTPETYHFSGVIQFESQPVPYTIENEIIEVGGGCEDECETQGLRECVDTISYRECDYHGGSCLTWSESQSCGTSLCEEDICQGVMYTDYVVFNSATQQSCNIQCSEGQCTACQTCQSFSETCNAGKECEASTNMCGGESLTCYYDASWQWGTPPSEETECSDGIDNDCNEECDYDSSTCSHGDSGCPVEVTAIAVDNENPIEYTPITVTCTASQVVNSIQAKIDDEVCSGTPSWQGNDASITCNVGPYDDGEKTVSCTVDESKSYKSGEDQTMTITLQESSCPGLEEVECGEAPECTWCVECNPASLKQSNGLGQDICIPTAGCNYGCDATACSADCDDEQTCDDDDCPDTCYNETTLFIIPDLNKVCNAACECELEIPGEQCSEEGTQDPCGMLSCETVLPELHVTGSCQKNCVEGGCENCELSYPDTCSCQEGWMDSDEDPSNGCEEYNCTQQWNCTPWTQGTCGDRTCTCGCPGGTGCLGDHSTHLECDPGDGGSPLVMKGGSPLVLKGGSPSLFKGGLPPPSDPCSDGQDNEGGSSNGCIDGDDYQCGGIETQCWGGVDNDCDGHVDCDDSDCTDSEYCEQGEGGGEQPLYSVSDIIDMMFTETPQPRELGAEDVQSVAEVEYFFGFVNWLIVAMIIILFLGLIFVEHIKPKFGKWSLPGHKMHKLEDFIVRKRRIGMTDDDIKAQLQKAGWIDEVISQEFDKLKPK